MMKSESTIRMAPGTIKAQPYQRPETMRKLTHIG
jgi:hypothetical protein